MLVKSNGAWYQPAGIEIAESACAPKPLPAEVVVERIGEPFLHDGAWYVDLFPADRRNGYYSWVPANQIEVDGMRLYIVRVMETHATTHPIFATDAQDALANTQEDCGGGPCEYVGTMPSETWTVQRDGVDVTEEYPDPA